MGAINRSGARILLWALPFLIMAAVVLADVLTGPTIGLMPLFSLGPAFAAVFYGLRSTVLIGAVAVALCVVDSLTFENGLSAREETLAFVTVTGVTAAAVIASVARQRRERELADVSTIAEVAQQVVLRPVPSQAGPVVFAVRYLSAAAHAQIGGDLYEVLPGQDGTLLIVGDVQGKGLAAVKTAAAVLGTFRAVAEEEADLEAIACRIETSLGRQLPGEEFVTAVLGHVSPDGSKALLLNCGHPAPLLLAPGKPARPVEPVAPSLPLGLADLAGEPRDATAVALAPGEALLFYTDGISEARDRGGDYYPLARGCAALDWREPGSALDQLRADVLRHVGHPLDDDAAMLLLARPEG